MIGGVAVLLWASEALLVTESNAMPPFQLVAMALAFGLPMALVKWRLYGERALDQLRVPLGAWALGVGGLFGFHACYFAALKMAPALEANLINYTWPLLIVLFSAALPGERLGWWHVAGALMGLAGVVLLLGDGRFVVESRFLLGYAAAAGSALTWAVYSVANRRYASVPSDAVGGFCAVTSILALIVHLAFEETWWPETAGEWLAIAALGIGPTGIAFFLWDHGTKHGDIRALGALSYLVPLISTLLLLAGGTGEATVALAGAAILIVGGALLAGREILSRR